jgi:hypothetical protein
VSQLVEGVSRGLVAARMLARLYQRGLVEPLTDLPFLVRDAPNVTELVECARQFLVDGQCERAAAVAATALRKACVPEAQAIYSEAERRMAIEAHQAIEQLEAVVIARESSALPRELTTADVYLYARLLAHEQLSKAIEATGLSDAAAYASMKRLLGAGLLATERA